ncbi:hypothetical protein PCASD_25210 [Puccinia coronata f. sp. avenae]|uniref:Uncharacterized protein n=1 Tax=Puccinia coronata f. sp. avenae TaxID=200324 RepID=A0A2N5TL89_9BASI|nr:hypothetical protein PCASD_25210 [Puccinia coronata f. sp. avenae]
MASRCTPAWRAGVRQHGEQVYASMASRCTPAWQAGVRQHGEQVYASMASRCTPAWRAALWVEFPASAGAHLPAFPRTYLPSRLYILLSKLAATCSASRLQPALQAGYNLLSKQAETCSPTRLQATGGGQVRFPGNRTGASHSKSWLKSDSPGIGLGGRQQRQRLLSSSSPQKQQRPLAAALGPRQRPLLSRVRCQPQQLPSCCFCGWLQSDPRGIRQEPGTGGATWFFLWLAKAGSCPIPGELDWSQPKQEPHCSCCGWLLSDSPGIGLGCPQRPLHSSLQTARRAGSSLQPAWRAGCRLLPASDWSQPKQEPHCSCCGWLLSDSPGIGLGCPQRPLHSSLQPARRAGSSLQPAQVAVCNPLKEQVAV